MHTARCPGCHVTFPTPTARPGARTNCPACGMTFAAGDDPQPVVAATPGQADTPRPRRRRDWGDPDEPAPPAGRTGWGRNTALLIGLSLAGVFVCGGGITVVGLAYVITARQEAERQVAGAVPQAPNQRVPPPLDAAAQVVQPVVLNVGAGDGPVTHQNVLAPNDPRFTGKPFKAYAVTLEAGRTYRIELASSKMDSFLRLYGPNGEPVSENDDFRGLDSGLVVTPDAGGPYTIHATVLTALNNNAPAPFTLTIRED